MFSIKGLSKSISRTVSRPITCSSFNQSSIGNPSFPNSTFNTKLISILNENNRMIHTFHSRNTSQFQIERTMYPWMNNLISTQNRYVTQDSQKGPTLFQQFKQIFKQQMQQDEKLQQSLKELKESKSGEIIEKTGEKVTSTVEKVKETTAPIREKVNQGLEKTSEKIIETTEIIAESKTVQFATQTVEKVKEQKIIKMVVDEWTREDQLRRQLHYIFRSEYGRKCDAERGVFWNPYTKSMEEFKEEKYDTETQDVTIVVDDERKQLNRFSGIIKRLDSIQSDSGLIASSRKLLKRVGESSIAKLPEEAEVMNAIKERDSTFDIDIFLGNLEFIIIPQLVNSFLTDEIESLKKIVTPNCFQRYLYPHIQSRVHAKQRFDTRILDISDLDLYASKFIGDNPTLIVFANISYIHCIIDLEGNILEGHKNDIRKVTGHFALRQDPSENSLDWEIVEAAFGMPERLAA